MGFLAPEPPPATPAPEMPKPPSPVTEPQGARPRRRSMSPTFLGGDATPGAGNIGGKTLLGQ